MDSRFILEFFGTAILILLGDGVVANNLLKGTKGQNAGWVVVTFAWGLAVFVGAYVAGDSGGHLNPVVTLGLYWAGLFDGGTYEVVGYIISQMLGGFVGACLVYILYKPHFDAEESSDKKFWVFCTAPEIRNPFYNCVAEVIGTYLLVIGIYLAGGAKIAGPFPVAMLIVVIGMSLGGPTGYAINPARDLPPRIAHALLPIKNKRDSDWGYAWVPVVGPLIGAALAYLTYLGFHAAGIV